MARNGGCIFDEQVQQVVEQSWEIRGNLYILVSVVDDDQSVTTSTSTDVDGLRMSIEENVAASGVADRDLVAVANNDDNYEDRPTVCDELKEISPNGKDVDKKPSDEEYIGLVSLPSKVRKKKKKKKASKLKEKGSAINNTKGEEVTKEECISSEGILSKF